jgi:aryl-alcohol dehydrogenase-like predicted oxidoreductase
METRTIGELDVSLVGLGCNNFGTRCDQDTVNGIIFACLDQGINHLDTADVYGNGASEEMLGKAVGSNRDEFVIATKFGLRGMDLGLTGGSETWVKRAIDQSLRRLDTDWIDLYQLHTPDSEVPISETLGALHEQVVAGKVREIGCSNFEADGLDNATDVAERYLFTPFASIQNRYSVLHREPEAEVLPVCADRGVAFVPFFPLESGLLTGKVGPDGPTPGTRLADWPEDRVADFLSDDKQRRAHRLAVFADSRGWSLLELSMSWLTQRPSVASVIAGATRPEQVLQNASATGWKMSDDELAEIDGIIKS